VAGAQRCVRRGGVVCSVCVRAVSLKVCAVSGVPGMRRACAVGGVVVEVGGRVWGEMGKVVWVANAYAIRRANGPRHVKRACHHVAKNWRR